MAPGGIGGSVRIVRQYSGRLTGEVISVTEDGRVWTNEHIYCGTGQSRGWRRGDRIEDAHEPSPPAEPNAAQNRHERRASAARRRK